MLRLDRVIKPWREADALNAQINLFGFWNESGAFLTKSGDLGIVLRVYGIDYESLDNGEQDYAVKRLESAFKGFGAGFHLYQYLFKSNGPNIPFATYDDPLIDAAINQRREFFQSKRDRLYQIEIFYVILLEGTRSKPGLFVTLGKVPSDPKGALQELKSRFSSNATKRLLRSEIDADLVKLTQRVENFSRQLADLVAIEAQGREASLTFFRRLVNFDDWRIAGKPRADQFLDYQVVNSDIEAERDHLRVGDHTVRVLTMKEAISETRPLVLDQLFKIPANFYVVTEWTPLSMAKARKEIMARRRHFNISKSGFISQMRDEKTPQRDQLIDESKQADIEDLGDCLRTLGNGQSLGEFSLSIVLYDRDRAVLDRQIGEFAGVFTNADGALFTETYNQLNAFFATMPGNYARNLRKLALLNSNYADLSFLFTILPGERWNQHLDAEYLAVLETDNETPYFLNLHNGEVAQTLILGMTGSGKTSTLETIREGAERSGYSVEGFAPTGRATAQLREAGIFADTLQGYLACGGRTQVDGDPGRRHLFMVDESSLSSTKQMREFLERIGSQDRVLLIGDTRQHQGVEAGKPFEQLQQAGMRTAHLDQIVRQKDPELLKAVEHLAKNETKTGIELLERQGRVTELRDPQQRIEAIAKDYAVRPENTLIVSPDNASRQAINQAVRVELQEKGAVAKDESTFLILTPRAEMAGADRAWAQKYQPQDVLHYSRGSKEHGIELGSYSTVVAINPKENLLTVRREDGQLATYDPKRLQGITAYREREREFAQGDRIQFTAPDRNLHVANRELATVEKIEGPMLTVRTDGEKARVLTFDINQMRHIDHGYAVTSHSSQGLTADRVLINMDTSAHADLINTRFAYVSVSRGSNDVQIYTNDAAALGQRLSADVSKTSAVDFQQRHEAHHAQQPMERTTADQRQVRVEQKGQPDETHQRHRVPIERALTPQEAQDFTWKRSYGEIQTYEHDRTHGRVHVDPQGQFYDRYAQPIAKEAALDHALGSQNHHAHANTVNEPSPAISKNRTEDHGQGISL